MCVRVWVAFEEPTGEDEMKGNTDCWRRGSLVRLKGKTLDQFISGYNLAKNKF